MGEVYRARDARLEREVALKVLPDASQGSERLARFPEGGEPPRVAEPSEHRGHPRDRGGETVVPAIVLELVEGRTLAERVRAARSAPEEAISLSTIQVARRWRPHTNEGDRAQGPQAGERDGPSDGMVKVLDFGLARAFSPPATSTYRDLRPHRLGLTTDGTVVGTPAYMTPGAGARAACGQAHGRLGLRVPLYELLAGRRAFQGRSVSDTIAAVVATTDWTALPPKRLVRVASCGVASSGTYDGASATLATRGSSSRDVAKGALAEAASVCQPQRRPTRRLALLGTSSSSSSRSRRLPRGVGGAASRSRSRDAVRVAPPANAPSARVGRDLAGRPEHRVEQRSGTEDLGQALDAWPRRLSRAWTPTQPSFSPDGRWIAYADRLDSSERCRGWRTSGDHRQLGGTRSGGCVDTGRDDVFATDEPSTGSGGFRTAAAGRAPDRPEPGTDHVWPESLPGWRASAVVTKRARDNDRDGGLDLDSGSLVASSRAAMRDTCRRGISSTERRGGSTRSGSTSRVSRSRVCRSGSRESRHPPNGGLCVGIGRDGTLAYLRNVTSEEERLLVWVDRNGREERSAPPANYVIPRLAPGGATWRWTYAFPYRTSGCGTSAASR